MSPTTTAVACSFFKIDTRMSLLVGIGFLAVVSLCYFALGLGKKTSLTGSKS
ncbi:hypothetical protein H4F52_03225 [Pectobacterium brasiliense]|uniref:hypothetical protein n=1 Tax=Pectobacterium brasiliense TaxID=180957 RepID=UPI0019694826|nr:hypothetical protein [Pectobacterium brasiliense]MBN3130773.1 hypothetical protein [Pectobacterium brasiliense]